MHYMVYLRNAATKGKTFKKLMKTQGSKERSNGAWAFRYPKSYPYNYRMRHNPQLKHLKHHDGGFQNVSS